ncbi:xanthine/uracil permease family protein, putative [Medicago truncatula]|uniref:Xanthine/uracil permease family protein, putative n=1 Tax=Medicago truncatula TaxID=3880 RepID=G7I686_MEDTR|nr:xanthine/uracil permease family protein, putative [Medicago truncatula]
MAQSQSGHTAAVNAVFALSTIFAGVTFLGAGWTQICPTNNITSDPKCQRSYFSPAFQANRLRAVVIIGISMILSFYVPHYFMEYKAVHGFGPVHLDLIFIHIILILIFLLCWFNELINVPFGSRAFVASVVTCLLDNTLHKGLPVRNNRPMYWNYAGTSDLDLYALPTLPFNQHQYFPLTYSIYTNILLRLSLFLRHS